MPTLYGSGDNAKVQRCLAAAKYGGVTLTLKEEAPPADKFPFGQYPGFEDGKVTLGTPSVIQFAVGGAQLRGQSEAALPLVADWVHIADERFGPLVLGAVLPALSLAPNNAETASEKQLEHLVHILNDHLVTRTFLVGERISHADLALAFSLLPAYQHLWDEKHRSQIGNVTRWFNTVMHQPEVASVVGTIKLCTAPAKFCPQKWKENQSLVGSGGGHHHGHHHQKRNHKDSHKDKKKEKKKSESEQPKKENKKKEEEPAEEMDDADAALAAEPKQKDPLSDLPKGTFNMDEFKRVYSNEDTVTKAIPYFWEKFDPEHYSIWYCEYKFPKELAQTFMSCNLIGGMFQRLEKLNKNAFASMCLFGTNNDSTISGVWIWRGHELVFPLCPDWQIDYESYEWKKLDAKAADTKALVDAFWQWDNFPASFKPFNQGKIFK